MIVSSFLPESVMKVDTCLRSSSALCRVIQPDFSMRSNRRDISGAAATMRAEISFLQRPSVPAPRRMRRTLYCCWVMSNWRSDLSAVFDNSDAVRRMLRNASCCKETKGRFCFSVTAKGDLLVVAISHSFRASPNVDNAAHRRVRLPTGCDTNRSQSSLTRIEHSRTVALPLVADGQLATLMSRCLYLIYQGDGVVLERNAAVPLLVRDKLGSAQPKFARSLARLEKAGRAEVGPIDVRRIEGS